ncbi:MAG TPA: type I methionyl aminopeptidase [Candidatus Kapabacteria bacterium]|nr:type I methionyl aminopeptidase [Candidatus Kapabacteria bacterium]
MYIKKPQEIERIREAGKRMGVILKKLSSMAVPGTTAWELDQEAERMILASGGIPAFKGYRGRRSDPPFPSTICASMNEEVVHGIATKEKKLKPGDIFSIDIGMQWPAKSGEGKDGNGFFVDTALTIPIGKVPKKTAALVDITKQALEIGIREAKPGNSIASIGRAIQAYVEPRGYGIIRDLVGHGVGHAVHEDPRVPNYYDEELEDWILEEGAVIAIEPMITLGSYEVETGDDGWTISTVDGSLSAHFEHTIVITKDGGDVVTRRPGEKV